MKVILVARKALAAYLVSSAVRRPVNSIGALLRIERAVDLAHDVAGALVLGADDDPVGTLEILDRGAFAQEFGVGDDRDVASGARLADDPLDLVAGADRHGRLGDDHGAGPDERCAISRGRAEDVGQVGMAVAAARRRADGDEDRLGARDRLGQIGGEGQPARARRCARPARRGPARRSASRRACSASILPASLSTQITSWPKSEKQAPDTRPT